jgi:hypothetical protein
MADRPANEEEAREGIAARNANHSLIRVSGTPYRAVVIVTVGEQGIGLPSVASSRSAPLCQALTAWCALTDDLGVLE